MWVWLDRAGSILFDATLSTAIFLTLVVLAMLVCRQPSRRILIARSALVASLAMIPLVAFLPLPRFDLFDTLIQFDLLPRQLVAEFERTGHSGSAPLSTGTSVTMDFRQRSLRPAVGTESMVAAIA